MKILAAALVSAGGRGLDIAAPFLLLYFRSELGIDDATVLWLYALLLVGAVVGPVLAGILSDRYGRRRTLIVYYALSAVGILSVVLAGGNLLLLAPLLLPFGTAVFSEGPVLQAFMADRAVGPLRDVAFSIYFTAAFGIGAVWAWSSVPSWPDRDTCPRSWSWPCPTSPAPSSSHRSATAPGRIRPSLRLEARRP